MNQGGPQNLLIIGCGSVAVFFDQTGGRAVLLGTKRASSVHTEQVAPLVEGQLLERVASLELGRYRPEKRPEQFRIKRIEHRAHLGVTGDLSDTEDPQQIGSI